jgi:hypothetical protein
MASLGNGGLCRFDNLDSEALERSESTRGVWVRYDARSLLSPSLTNVDMRRRSLLASMLRKVDIDSRSRCHVMFIIMGTKQG